MPGKDGLCSSKQNARRPRCVSILAVLQILQGLAFLGYGSYVVVVHGWPGVRSSSGAESPLVFLFEEMTSGASQMLIALPILVVSVALLRLRSWAWLFAMALQGLSLVLALFAYAIQRPNYALMLLGIILVFYLNQQDVQIAFREPRGSS